MGVEAAEGGVQHPDPQVGVDQPGREFELPDDRSSRQGGAVQRRRGVGQVDRPTVGVRHRRRQARTTRGLVAQLQIRPLTGSGRAETEVERRQPDGSGGTLGADQRQGYRAAERERVEHIGGTPQAVEPAAQPAGGRLLRPGGGEPQLGRREVTEVRRLVASVGDHRYLPEVVPGLQFHERRVQPHPVGERQHRIGNQADRRPLVQVGGVGGLHHGVEHIVAAAEHQHHQHAVVVADRWRGPRRPLGIGEPVRRRHRHTCSGERRADQEVAPRHGGGSEWFAPRQAGEDLGELGICRHQSVLSHANWKSGLISARYSAWR